MKVLVTGGRDYADRAHVYDVLDKIHAANGIELLMHGAFPYVGADILAEDWAKTREIDYRGFPAKFKTTGRKASGPERNQRMVANYKPDLVVAFPGGRGTADCVTRAREARITVHPA